MAQSTNGYEEHVSILEKELEEYMHASNVNVSNLVSVKLSGHSNYHIWKAQMLLLLDKLMIHDIVETRRHWLQSKSKNEDFVKKYDILLKGWILGSLNEELLRHFDYSASAECMWMKLEDEYCFRWYPTALALKLYKLHLKSTKEPTDKVLMEITRNFPSVGIGESLICPSWESAGQKMVKRSSLLFYSFDYLCERAEGTLWRMRRFKNNCYSWLLPEIVMLLLVPIAVLYPLYQLILLVISELLLPFYILYSLLWKVLATVDK